AEVAGPEALGEALRARLGEPDVAGEDRRPLDHDLALVPLRQLPAGRVDDREPDAVQGAAAVDQHQLVLSSRAARAIADPAPCPPAPRVGSAARPSVERARRLTARTR